MVAGHLQIKNDVYYMILSYTDEQTIVREDRAKTKSSLRSLPLVPRFETAFKERKEQHEENRRVCGNCYCTEYLNYIFVNGLGSFQKYT